MTIIMVSHDLQLLKDLVDRIVYVNRKLRWISEDSDTSLSSFLQLGN